MAGLVSLVDLVAVVKTRMGNRAPGTVVLGVTLLINVIAAESPVADESLLGSTHRAMGFLRNVFSPTRPSISPSPTFIATPFENQDTHGTQPSITQPPHESVKQSDLNVKVSQRLYTPSLRPSQLVLGSFTQTEEYKHSIDWKVAQINSPEQTFLLLQTPSVSQMQTQLNTSKPSVFQRPTVPQVSSTKEVVQDIGSSEMEKKIPTVTSLSDKRTDPLNFSDNPLDESYILDQVLLDPRNGPSTIPYENQLRPSDSLMPENNLLNIFPNPHEILSPSYHVPFIGPHLTLASYEPTEAPPEDFYPKNTIDFDWGSGDYLETIAFLNPEEEGYSLVTKVPDTYDEEDYREHYNTAFPSRVVTSLSSLHHLHILPSSSLTIVFATHLPHKSMNPSSLTPVHSTIDHTLDLTPTITSELVEASESIDWPDNYSIQPTDVLLPDMNSLEYYTTQLTKENSGTGSETEQRSNVTVISISSSDIMPTSSITKNLKVTEYDSDNDLSGVEPHGEATITRAAESFNSSKTFLDHSVVTTPYLDPSFSIWATLVSTTDWSAGTQTVGLHSSVVVLPSHTDFLPDIMASFSLTDVQWFVTEVLPINTTIHPTSVDIATTAFSSGPTDHLSATTEQAFNITSISSTGTLPPPIMLGDQGVTKDDFDNTATMTLIPTNSRADAITPTTGSPNPKTNSHQPAVTPVMGGEWQTTSQKSRQYLCNLENPKYLIKIGMPSGAKVGYAKSQVGEILKREFNKSVELQVIEPPPKFVFRVVSDPVVYTAMSVINALQSSGHRFLFVSPHWMIPDNKYQVHTVLQFVPGHIDVRFCNFSESIERGLTMAFAEVRQGSNTSTNFTVHIINITMAVPKNEQRLGRYPVDITFTVRSPQGYLMGSEVSIVLMKLTKVEFSYYMGFPVMQIAEPFHYPKLNTSQFLRSSWVRTVLLGVLDSELGQRTFQAKIERRVAMLLGEALGLVRRVKRATDVGNSSIQIVSMNRPVGVDHPLEVVYFVERPDGQRVPAVEMANILNSLDVQKAAIILGYRFEGILAQPVEEIPSSPSDTQNPNMWIIIGVVIPLLVVIIIIAILYWKLCRTDKLEFQPDAMTSIQQRQKSATSQTPVHKGLPQHERGIEFSEEEEWRYEEEEGEYEENEEEEINIKSRKGTLTPKSKPSTSSEEEEEEEEEENKGDEQEQEIKKFEKKPLEAEEKNAHENKTTQKRKEEMRKKQKMTVFPKGRRDKQELQAPSVKGFDFAKLHLGQQNKDDVMVVQESIPAGPLPISDKEGPSLSLNGDVPTPISKNSASSSTKASRSFRRRERISPSDGDSVVSDRSSGRESTDENLRAQATPSDSKQTLKAPINVLSGPPPTNGLNEQMSSASIFEHVDRMSRATDVSRRLPNKVQLIAMQPMTVPHLNRHIGKLPDTNKIHKEIQVEMRQKSETEHHRNKIRLRAKRKGHYDFPAMDDIDIVDIKDQDHIYHKAQMQMDKILDRNAQIPSIFKEPQNSTRGKHSPKQKMKQLPNGRMTDADKDHLITEDADAVYRKCPGVNNVAYVSDPDQVPGLTHRSPSPTDEVFLGSASSPPGHAPPPPPYIPPQPSIEEARQQMHSLLDDAFALVSPTSQGSSAGVTLPGVNFNASDSSPPGHGPRPWGSSYQGLGPHTSRFSDLSVSPPLVQGLMSRQDRGLSYLPPGEAGGPGNQLRLDNLYSNRGLYSEALPTSARPRPVGGGTGAQLHHLTQVGLANRMNGLPAGVRGYPGQNNGVNWNNYHEDSYCRALPDNSAMARSVHREPSAPPTHLDTGAGYLSAPLSLDTTPPTQSSASLIKAIREELLRLSQKQGYHS